MILKINPPHFLRGRIDLPASKSYSIRAFIVAACGGRSLIINPSDCDDALVAMNVAKALGAKITRVKKNSFKVVAFEHAPKSSRIHVKESGTVLRLILPLASLNGKKSLITGEGTLIGRPNLHLTTSLRKMGVDLKGRGPNESIPIKIKGGALRGGNIEIDGTLSSQFISALLLACPLLREDTHLVITGHKLVSTSYITMTLQILRDAGIKIKQVDQRTFLIKGQQKYRGLRFTVPSDYGLAAFLLAAASLSKSNVSLLGHMKEDFVQSDGQILSFLHKMGVRFSKTGSAITIKGPFPLKGGDFSLKDCPDLVPIMAVMALFAKGRTRLLDVKHARVKESDRISDLRGELLKVGARISETESSLIIEPQEEYRSNCLLDPHGDHRLAMAFSVLGIKLGVRVKDIACTAKSYPGFVRDLKSMGVSVSQR